MIEAPRELQNQIAFSEEVHGPLPTAEDIAAVNGEKPQGLFSKILTNRTAVKVGGAAGLAGFLGVGGPQIVSEAVGHIADAPTPIARSIESVYEQFKLKSASADSPNFIGEGTPTANVTNPNAGPIGTATPDTTPHAVTTPTPPPPTPTPPPAPTEVPPTPRPPEPTPTQPPAPTATPRAEVTPTQPPAPTSTPRVEVPVVFVPVAPKQVVPNPLECTGEEAGIILPEEFRFSQVDMKKLKCEEIAHDQRQTLQHQEIREDIKKHDENVAQQHEEQNKTLDSIEKGIGGKGVDGGIDTNGDGVADNPSLTDAIGVKKGDQSLAERANTIIAMLKDGTSKFVPKWDWKEWTKFGLIIGTAVGVVGLYFRREPTYVVNEGDVIEDAGWGPFRRRVIRRGSGPAPLDGGPVEPLRTNVEVTDEMADAVEQEQEPIVAPGNRVIINGNEGIVIGTRIRRGRDGREYREHILETEERYQRRLGPIPLGRERTRVTYRTFTDRELADFNRAGKLVVDGEVGDAWVGRKIGDRQIIGMIRQNDGSIQYRVRDGRATRTAGQQQIDAWFEEEKKAQEAAEKLNGEKVAKLKAAALERNVNDEAINELGDLWAAIIKNLPDEEIVKAAEKLNEEQAGKLKDVLKSLGYSKEVVDGMTVGMSALTLADYTRTLKEDDQKKLFQRVQESLEKAKEEATGEEQKPTPTPIVTIPKITPEPEPIQRPTRRPQDGQKPTGEGQKSTVDVKWEEITRGQEGSDRLRVRIGDRNLESIVNNVYVNKHGTEYKLIENSPLGNYFKVVNVNNGVVSIKSRGDWSAILNENAEAKRRKRVTR